MYFICKIVEIDYSRKWGRKFLQTEESRNIMIEKETVKSCWQFYYLQWTVVK